MNDTYYFNYFINLLSETNNAHDAFILKRILRSFV